MKRIISLLLLIGLLVVTLVSCDLIKYEPFNNSNRIDIQTNTGTNTNSDSTSNNSTDEKKIIPAVSSGMDYGEIPAYTKGEPFVVIGSGEATFSSAEIVNTSYEYYSDLDKLGRCGCCVACVGKDLMPTEERGSISSVKPSGWKSVQYDNVDGKSLYNRCHLIGFQLTGENANYKNLITGTRSMNVDGMLPFENMIADYIKETNNHVMYRVIPIFEGNNLVANGVVMEAYSVEDEGDGINFCVFAYNVQDGIKIDYSNGDSELVKESSEDNKTNSQGSNTTQTYVLNTNSKKFHYPSCDSISQISDKNRSTVSTSRKELINQGYQPCKSCNP